METKKEISIEYSFQKTRAEANVIPTHIHDGYEIVYYMTGKGKSVVGDVQYDYYPNTYCIIPAKMPHSEYSEKETDLICIRFVYNDCYGPLARGIYADEDKTILEMVSEIYKELQQRRAYCSQISESLLEYIILVHLRSGVKDSVQMPEISDCSALDRALKYIYDYYSTDINPRELADSIGYSYDRFRHIFKEKYGKSVKQMLIYKRIDAAKQMLREGDGNGDIKIEKIALDFGFGSASEFAVMFGKISGMTPSEYRALKKSSLPDKK